MICATITAENFGILKMSSLINSMNVLLFLLYCMERKPHLQKVSGVWCLCAQLSYMPEVLHVHMLGSISASARDSNWIFTSHLMLAQTLLIIIYSLPWSLERGWHPDLFSLRWAPQLSCRIAALCSSKAQVPLCRGAAYLGLYKTILLPKAWDGGHAPQG